MTTALYIVWCLIPGTFFLIAFWAKLETLGGRPQKENAFDYVRQGMFVSICVGVAVLIDQYALEGFANSVLQGFIPLSILRISLLPIILLIASMLAGPSEQILITKAPRPTQRKSKK